MRSKEIILIDLFSGIGGFALGLKNAGFKIVKHYFSEIDHHSIANYKKNFPNAEYIGNIKFIQSRDFGRNVAITFGSPCQDFSMAGKRRGLGGERSSLIEYALSTIVDVQPDFFIWENVKGAYSSNDRADFWAIIKAFADLDNYRFEKQLVNTAWLLPQNRERIYLVGHLAGRSRPGIFPIGQNEILSQSEKESKEGQSQAKHIAKALTSGTDPGMKATDNFILMDMNGRNVNVTENPITGTLDANYSKGVESNYGARPFISAPKIAGTLTAGGNSGGLHSDMTVIKSGTLRTHKDGNGFRENKGENIPTIPARSRTDGSGQPVVKVFNLIPRSGDPKKGGTGLLTKENETFCLDTGNTNAVEVHEDIRRLTEIECERLQDFPDDWTKYGMYLSKKVNNYIFGKKKKWRTEKATNVLFVHAVNNTTLVKKEIPPTARYKQCGNAVTAKMTETIGTRIELL